MTYVYLYPFSGFPFAKRLVKPHTHTNFLFCWEVDWFGGERFSGTGFVGAGNGVVVVSVDETVLLSDGGLS